MFAFTPLFPRHGAKLQGPEKEEPAQELVLCGSPADLLSEAVASVEVPGRCVVAATVAAHPAPGFFFQVAPVAHAVFVTGNLFALAASCQGDLLYFMTRSFLQIDGLLNLHGPRSRPQRVLERAEAEERFVGLSGARLVVDDRPARTTVDVLDIEPPIAEDLLFVGDPDLMTDRLHRFLLADDRSPIPPVLHDEGVEDLQDELGDLVFDLEPNITRCDRKHLAHVAPL